MAAPRQHDVLLAALVVLSVTHALPLHFWLQFRLTHALPLRFSPWIRFTHALPLHFCKRRVHFVFYEVFGIRGAQRSRCRFTFHFQKISSRATLAFSLLSAV